MRSWFNLGNKRVHSTALAIALSGCLLAPAVSADAIKVSLVEMDKTRKVDFVSDDFEIGSTLVMKVSRVKIDDLQMGSFSREDGSRAGAYGDGEFAN